MAITLSPETLELIESQMKNLGCANPDEFLEKLICEEFPTFEVDMDLLDPETRAAIEEGDRQIEQGMGIPWEEARDQLRANHHSAPRCPPPAQAFSPVTSLPSGPRFGEIESVKVTSDMYTGLSGTR